MITNGRGIIIFANIFNFIRSQMSTGNLMFIGIIKTVTSAILHMIMYFRHSINPILVSIIDKTLILYVVYCNICISILSQVNKIKIQYII